VEERNLGRLSGSLAAPAGGHDAIYWSMRRVSVTLLSISITALQLTACASARHSSDSVAGPVPTHEPSWHTHVDEHHPLVGRIWDGRSGTFVERATLVDTVVATRFVLLGEKHDNEDHHVLQAALLEAAIARGRKPAVVMEMIDVDQDEALAAQRAKTPRDSDALAKAVRWEERHWPSFAFYRPIVQHALDAELPLLGGNHPTKAIKSMFAPGAVLDAEHVADLPEPLPDALRVALEKELADSHCGALPTSMIPAMVIAQRMRDETMAKVLADHEKPDGAFLVAGDGHVRKDRGVPYALAHRTKAGVISVTMMEVVAGRVAPAEYVDVVSGAPAFDFVWFTPRVDDADPCAAMKSTK
jgi:uncharacterized iron-regulated protein